LEDAFRIQRISPGAESLQQASTFHYEFQGRGNQTIDRGTGEGSDLAVAQRSLRPATQVFDKGDKRNVFIRSEF
jgi:hypothetical protein